MERIETVDDPRVAAYRNLRERTLRGESIFIAEGRLVAERLLESDYEAASVFCSDEYADEFQQKAGADVPVYVATEKLLLEVAGFPFHRGVLAAGRRPPPLTLDEMMAPVSHVTDTGEGTAAVGRWIICPHVTNQENMGLVFRTAAAFGVDGIVLGHRCCDPLSRRCLRTSMGAVFRVPFIRGDDLLEELRSLKRRWGVELFAAVLDQQAERLDEVCWPARAGILLGHEFEGLGPQWLAECDRRVTIPMQPGTDSLNLGVAAGIFVYAMTRRNAGF